MSSSRAVKFFEVIVSYATGLSLSLNTNMCDVLGDVTVSSINVWALLIDSAEIR